MTLEIKDAFSPEISRLAEWIPDDPSDVCFSLEVSIGEAGSDASDVFGTVVATPRGLAQLVRRRTATLSGGARIVMPEYSWDGLQERLRVILAECDAQDWQRSCTRLRAHFHWEYEGM